MKENVFFTCRNSDALLSIFADDTKTILSATPAGYGVLLQALAKAWRFGQQMRQYFDYGDVRDAVNSQMELQRQQVRIASTRYASILLELTMHLTADKVCTAGFTYHPNISSDRAPNPLICCCLLNGWRFHSFFWRIVELIFNTYRKDGASKVLKYRTTTLQSVCLRVFIRLLQTTDTSRLPP